MSENEQEQPEQNLSAEFDLALSLETSAEKIAAIREQPDYASARELFDEFATDYYPCLRMIAQSSNGSRISNGASWFKANPEGEHGIAIMSKIGEHGWIDFSLADLEILNSPEHARDTSLPIPEGKISGLTADQTSKEASYFEYFRSSPDQLADFAQAIAVVATIAVDAEALNPA